MPKPERVAYRASDSFTTKLRDFMERHNAARLAALAYNEAHPDCPLYVERRQIDHTVTVAGFVDVRPDQQPPKGLSRAQNRDYLIPARGGAGTAWRAVREEYDQFPRLGDEVFKPHGLSVYRFVDGMCNVAGVHDLGEYGVFVTFPGGYPESNEHLIPVPLSVFYAAQEAHAAASAVVS